jgi:hypothetical protein
MRTKTTPLIAAAALVTGSATNASAVLILFIDQDIPIPATFAGVSVDLETGATSDILAGAIGADLNFVYGGEGVSNDADQTTSSPSWQPVRLGTGNTDAIENLAFDTVVGPASVTATDFGGSSNNFPIFTSGVEGYIGFSVVLADATLAYGWAEVTLQNDNTPGVIHSWAYDNAGAPVRVGAVPEPTQTLMIALSLAASALRRRR